MKKMILFAILIMSLSFVFAELEVDIPFDMDMIGDDFSIVGSYIFESDWITITNIGSTNETYSLIWSYNDLPVDWTASVCNDLGLCFIANMAASVDINAGESLLVHFVLGVNSTGGCGLNITLDGGDLTEPISLDFTFNTADNVSADDNLLVPEQLSQNYPNPFNPSTTISYELPQQELASAVITIYNTKGQHIKTFNNLNTNGNIVWDGRDKNNNIVNSGVYFYKLNSIKTSKVRKMILMK